MPMILIINNIRISKAFNYVVVFIRHSDLAHRQPYGEIGSLKLCFNAATRTSTNTGPYQIQGSHNMRCKSDGSTTATKS